jgi:hypothetical protein
MSVLTTSRTSLAPAITPMAKRHQFWLSLFICAAVALTLALAIYGFDYYRLDQAHRVLSPKHAYLKPSGTIGLRLAFLGVALFLLIYLYAILKHWSWLSKQGNTRHWLNFHVILGVTAPVVITFHSSFKFHGLAGVAYWIMIAVALIGFVGRYIYSQIPRSLGAAEVSLKDLSNEMEKHKQKLSTQEVLGPEDFAPLLQLPSASVVQSMSALGVLWLAMRYDLARPSRIWELRRKAIRSFGGVASFHGVVRSHHPPLETAIECVKEQASLIKKTLLLSKMQEMFQLWHVVHRPFSYSFSILAVMHIAVALVFGYF